MPDPCAAVAAAFCNLWTVISEMYQGCGWVGNTFYLCVCHRGGCAACRGGINLGAALQCLLPFLQLFMELPPWVEGGSL